MTSINGDGFSVTPNFSNEDWSTIIDYSAKQQFGELLDTAGETIAVKLMKNEHESFDLDTGKIIEISQNVFSNLGGESKVKFSKDLHKLGENITKYLERDVDYKIRKQLNDLKFTIEDEFDVPEVISEEQEIQNNLSDLINKFNEDTSIATINEASGGNLNTLFLPLGSEPSFINQLINIYQNEPAMGQSTFPLFSHLIKNIDQLNPENKTKLINALFRSTTPSIFENLMRTSENNTLFDTLLKTALDEDFLNENTDIRTQIYVFAFSSARYESFWISDSALNPEEIAYAKSIHEQFLSPTYSDAYPAKRSSPDMQPWIQARMSISSTLTSNSPNVETLKEQWNQVEVQIFEMAMAHRGTHEIITLEQICALHKQLMSGEIDAPGTLRHGDQIVRSTGGTFTPPTFLQPRMKEFFDWFNQQCQLCDEGKANPVSFAYEATQRFVSLHPFQNGNGRISVLLMDYVLQRYGLPPPIIDRGHFSPAVFPLRTDRPNHAENYAEYLKGISKSLSQLGLEK